MKYLHYISFLIIFFVSCNKENLLSEQSKKEYIIKGKAIGQETVKELGSNLMKHMKSGGTLEAIPFCNTAASNLTNEIATKYNVTIKRTSHKTRSVANFPNTREIEILKRYLTDKKNHKKLKPIVEKDTLGKVHFYAPIKVEGKCLSCHGTIGKEVTKETNELLKSLYPNDKATGFKVGDLRGMVNITFNK